MCHTHHVPRYLNFWEQNACNGNCYARWAQKIVVENFTMLRCTHTIIQFISHIHNFRPEELHRMRVEQMERQLANLTGIVQKVLVNPTIQPSASQPQFQNFNNAPPYKNGKSVDQQREQIQTETVGNYSY